MDNNNLEPNKQYFIRYANNKYIGTYKETTTNLNGTEIYKFKDINKIPNKNNYTFDYDFPVKFTILKELYSNNSILGKRQTTTINDNELDAKKSKTDMTFTEEDILKDREYWESVDGGGKRTRRVKRKSKKNKKSKKRKSRKYNK